ncbi:hypothetical protein GCM10009127_11820 [Alteraurantiacibacter aestuarii]|uniref:Uncharacterized protein n=1 Tax=Alteraurantiacibacter aestuarii TaxID=650004 RepID=A0A844ZIF5_9SPHN|nr:hypothetical protein [Alteraurantiacibacter aestuarii]MXO87568.1 hypothetical protein [Alteraurantiacibacter aestuarii]
MAYLGAIILAGVMLYALYSVFTGARDRRFNYFGKTITLDEHPWVYFLMMAVLIVALLMGARALPLFLVSIL